MKKFIKNLGVFLLVLMVTLTLPVYFLSEIIEEKKIFTIPPNTQYLFLGNSRPECAINDKFIENAYNFSNSGEAYFFTYIKARELKENNSFKNLKAVFIQYTLADVSHVRDEWVWGQAQLQNNYPKYLPSFTIGDFEILSQENLDGLLSVHFFQTGLRQLYYLLRFNLKELRDYYGGYFPSFEKYKKSPQQFNRLIQEPENYHKLKLMELVQLFKTKNIPVYLISCPIHPSKWKVEKHYNSRNFLVQNKIKAEYLDFSNFPLPDHYFADRSHLNYYGAEQFSKFFNQMLKEGLLHQNNKQHLINLKEGQITNKAAYKGI